MATRATSGVRDPVARSAGTPRGCLPPGPPLPRLVQTWLWFKHPTTFLTRCRRRYGDVFTVRLPLGNDLVQLADPSLVKAVFTGDNSALHAGEASRELLEPILGPHSVILLDGPAHLRQRKLMLPSFHGERIRSWSEAITAITAAEVSRWPRNRAMAIRPAMQAITLDVIMRLIFGLDEGARKRELSAQLTEIARMGRNPLRLALTQRWSWGGRSPWARFIAARRRLDATLLAEIQLRRQTLDLASREDVFSQLLLARDDDGRPMSDDEIRDELVTLLFAGHETTATALAWTFDLLLHAPAALARLEAELASGQSAYLEAVIKESLRLHPPVVIVVRRVKSPVVIGGRSIPAGASLCPNIFLSHRQPEVYAEPDRFRPERFLESAAEPYSWLPFGGGIRRCLGASFANLEMRIVIPEVLRHCRLQPASPQPDRPRREAVLLVPDRGTRVIVNDR